MKTLIALTLISLFAASGCSDFIGTNDSQESRASRPKPADYSTKKDTDEIRSTRDTAKAAPTLPSSK
ncbi:MAG: hypothetical protein IT280_02210 [Ignavibacteria bacterium]|nr:hypothetical protein [Ignavibacteria bacterium]